MERTPDNNSFNNSTTQNPAQNELDLEFNHMEPITPKKTVKSEPSFLGRTFDKAKNVFGKKESGGSPQFSVRKEPGFGQSSATSKLENEEDFFRKVELIRKGHSGQPQNSDSGYTSPITFGQAVAQSKGVASHTSRVNNSQTVQISSTEAATTQNVASAGVVSQHAELRQTQHIPVPDEGISAQINAQTAEITDDISAQVQTRVSDKVSEVVVESRQNQAQATTEFVDIPSTQLKAQTITGLSEVTSVPPTLSTSGEASEREVSAIATTQTTVPQTVTGFSDVIPPATQTEEDFSADNPSLTSGVQTTMGFADAMSKQMRIEQNETATGFSEATTEQTRQPSTQGFSETIKPLQPTQTISGFSDAIAEQQAQAEKAIVVEVAQTESATPQLQDIDSLTDNIAAQVKTQIADELLHNMEPILSSNRADSDNFTDISEQNRPSDKSLSISSQAENRPNLTESPLTISLEKEINAMSEQKSLQNDGFFDRTLLSNSVSDVTVRPSVTQDVSAENDFVNEFKSLQTKNNDEPLSSEDDFLNEFEAIKTKAQNEEPVREKKMKNPENWSVMQKLPPKHRRLFIAVLTLLVLLIVLFWLKPNSPTVEDFQAQSNNNALPIEFQPLDQSQNIEDHNASAAPAQQNNVQEQPENQAEQTSVTENAPVETASVLPQAASETAQLLIQESSVLARGVLQLPMLTGAASDTADNDNVQVSENNQPKSASERIKAMEQRAAAQQPTAKQQKLSRAEREKQQREARKAAQNNKAGEDQLAEPISAGRAKTLTVPSGVSLMQVFRDNNLNIADVNAMTKAAGGNVLNNFKPGDKVQVVVNSQGRVNILRLSNGATFTRQANGTYKYHP